MDFPGNLDPWILVAGYPAWTLRSTSLIGDILCAVQIIFSIWRHCTCIQRGSVVRFSVSCVYHERFSGTCWCGSQFGSGHRVHRITGETLWRGCAPQSRHQDPPGTKDPWTVNRWQPRQYASHWRRRRVRDGNQQSHEVIRLTVDGSAIGKQGWRRSQLL